MKKLRNIFICFIVIGVVLCVASAALYGFNPHKVYADITQSKNYELVEKEFDEVKDSIKLDFDDANLTISPSTDGKYKLSYYKNTESGEETTDYEGGKLHLKYKEKWTFKSLRAFNITDPKYYKASLTVPAGFIGNIKLIVHNGRLDISGLGGIDTLDIESHNGSTVLSSIAANSIKTESRNGAITLKNIESQTGIAVTNDNGNIKLENCVAGGELNIDNSNGVIRVENGAFSSAVIKDDNGTITLENCTVLNGTSLKNSNGSTSLYDCRGGSVTVKNDNGRIKVERGEFDVVHVENSNGSNNVELKGSRSDYGVELVTSNGSSKLNGANFSGSDGNKTAAKSVYLKAKNGSNSLNFI